ncbi:MAG TPA: FlgD immunoglobulin-like domain containing protein, partial [Polyangia bacterium]|nr:FlgD immunoglobulin-like domain containing protein [Polyangia bacterium]
MSRLVACVALLVWMAAWTGATAGTYPISYHLTRPGRVSLVVTDTSGSTVREILRAVPLAGGDHTSIWDGLDREGKGVPAGTYRWRLLETQGLSARYELSVGSSYPRGEDRSSSGGPGSHIAPYTMAADETGIYVAALQTENLETGLLKLSPDGGKRLWSQQLPFGSDGRQVAWEGGLSMAVDRGEVYLLGHREPQRIFVSRADTGRGARAFEVGWDAPSYDADAEEALTGATDMDVRDGVLVVAYSSRNVVRWYDPMTGKSLGAAGVAAPAGVAVGPAGTVYVTTGDKIVRLSRERPAQATIAAGLTRPGRLAVDRSNGELLVFQRGDSQQVRRLTAAGQTLRIYGIAGGRREGLYVDRDFAGASDIAADGRGGFLIAEPFAAPRRVAQVARDGAVSHEWYGGQPWAPSAVFEAGNPDVMWVTSAKTKRVHWVMRVLVDH